MEPYSQSQESPKQANMPLKVFEIVVFIAVLVFSAWYYYTNFYLQKTSQILQLEEIRAQIKNAIEKRDVALCPTIQSSFTDSAVPFPDKDPFGEIAVLDNECVTAVEKLKALDVNNAIVIRAIQEKNEKLCELAEKSFKSTCVDAVRSGISGTVKPLADPILGR